MSNQINGPLSKELWQRADEVIPRGGIFLTRSARFAGDDVMPGFIDVAKGCRVNDIDGRSYIDFNCGNGPNLLGYGHAEIDAAANAQAEKSDLAPFFNAAMVEYAEKLVAWSETMQWVVPVKNGSDATNLAIRTMRAARQRPVIILFKRAYHGFGSEFSLAPEFEPEGSTGNIIRLPWNDVTALNKITRAMGDSIAGVLMNPLDQNPATETRYASEAFIEAIAELRRRTGALLALDDVRSGFRLHARGSHHFLGIEPDLLCLGKALGNGHAVSALLGGSLVRGAVEKVQLTATYMFSAVAHRAGIGVLHVYERDNVLSHIQMMGERLVKGLTAAGLEAGHRDVLLSGPATMPTFLFREDVKAKRARIFAREAALRGAIFHPTLNWFLCDAHRVADIDEAIAIGAESFKLTPTSAERL